MFFSVNKVCILKNNYTFRKCPYITQLHVTSDPNLNTHSAAQRGFAEDVAYMSDTELQHSMINTPCVVMVEYITFAKKKNMNKMTP